MKKTLDDLAWLGGEPLFSKPRQVGAPNIGDRRRMHDYLDEILDRRRLTNQGPCAQQLERRLADLLQVKHCLVTCNGTMALQMAIKALDLSGEVIVPAFTFVATVHALQWMGLQPVFCDVDPGSHQLDPAKVERCLTPRTRAILAVHLWGRPAPVTALARLARDHRLKLLFDAAHAFACSTEGKEIGHFGDAELFSFHATKVFNTFEGGAVATNNDLLAERIRALRNFGFSGDDVADFGINGKMNEVCAAMGLVNLDSLDEVIETNFHHYDCYRAELAGLPGVRVLPFPEAGGNKFNYHYLVLEIDPRATGISRDLLLEMLSAENIRARRYFFPGCHRMPPYLNAAGVPPRLPVTERLCEEVLVLPMGTAVSRQEVKSISRMIRWILEHARELQARSNRHKVREPLCA